MLIDIKVQSSRKEQNKEQNISLPLVLLNIVAILSASDICSSLFLT